MVLGSCKVVHELGMSHRDIHPFSAFPFGVELTILAQLVASHLIAKVVQDVLFWVPFRVGCEGKIAAVGDLGVERKWRSRSM